MIKEIVKTIPVCKASPEDINKALRPKPGLTLEEAKNRLPNKFKDFAYLFADCKNSSFYIYFLLSYFTLYFTSMT